MKLWIAFALCSTTLAAADIVQAPPPPTHVDGDQAKALIRALRRVGAPSKHVKTKDTYAFKTISCSEQRSEQPGVIEDIECQLDGKKYTLAQAEVLMTGMRAAGIPEPYRMAKKEISANGLSCTYDSEPHEGSFFACTYTAAN